MRILTVVGARPQFIKAAPFSRALTAQGHDEFLVHTGQHYDDAMSAIFFEQLNMSAPDANLGVGGGSHAEQMAGMIVPLEAQMIDYQPDYVLVYGDTNSTIATALAAAKLHIPIAHVEAGLRSYNRKMPEEINRVLTDELSTLLFCPTDVAVKNLAKEGITEGVHKTGDIMLDAVRIFADIAQEKAKVYQQLALNPDTKHAVATIHRPANTDNVEHLKQIVEALNTLAIPVIFPMHPRTRKAVAEHNLSFADSVHIIEPVGYLDMLALLSTADVVITDSGGLQKEAFFNKTPCVTVRTETEWVETIELGWNRLVAPTVEAIHEGVKLALTEQASSTPPIYGDGYAAEKMVNLLEDTGIL